MKLVFQTNLDAAKPEVRALNERARTLTSPSAIPRDGDKITFPFKKDGKPGFSFDLQVVSVSFNYVAEEIVVELHIPTIPSRSIAEWTEWFNHFRYGHD